MRDVYIIICKSLIYKYKDSKFKEYLVFLGHVNNFKSIVIGNGTVMYR